MPIQVYNLILKIIRKKSSVHEILVDSNFVMKIELNRIEILTAANLSRKRCDGPEHSFTVDVRSAANDSL
ncbi:hypothetical protein T06_3950 [Trichinella sp. T6]|nr:hypothetical protein T06_3950 [Trichinella sp. T6]